MEVSRAHAFDFELGSLRQCTGKGETSYTMSLVDVEEIVGFMTFDQAEDMDYKSDEDEIYAMQVKVQEASNPDRCGLVLQPVGTAKTFERFGVFQLDEQHLDVFSSIISEIVTLV